MKQLLAAMALCVVGLAGAALGIEGGGVVIIIGVVLLLSSASRA